MSSGLGTFGTNHEDMDVTLGKNWNWGLPVQEEVVVHSRRNMLFLAFVAVDGFVTCF